MNTTTTVQQAEIDYEIEFRILDEEPQEPAIQNYSGELEKQLQQYLSNLRIIGDSRITNLKDVNYDFTKPKKDIKLYLKEYTGKNQNTLNQHFKKIQSIRQVRGDGNCFFTAFFYSIVENFLKCNCYNELAKIISETKISPVLFQGKNAQQNNVQQISQYLIYQLHQLSSNQTELENKFKRSSNYFYEALIIWARSFSYIAYNDIMQFYSEFGQLEDAQNLLEWEYQFNTLLKKLNMQKINQKNDYQKNRNLQLYQFDTVEQYNCDSDKPQFEIYLLYTSGHYEILYSK